MFLLVPAYPGCPGSKAVKWLLLLLLLLIDLLNDWLIDLLIGCSVISALTLLVRPQTKSMNKTSGRASGL